LLKFVLFLDFMLLLLLLKRRTSEHIESTGYSKLEGIEWFDLLIGTNWQFMVVHLSAMRPSKVI
jgi:hypothetical protein